MPAWNAEHGHHEKIVPGYGLHKIFKAKQGIVEPGNKNDLIKIKLEKNLSFLRTGDKIKDNFTEDVYKINNNSIESFTDSQVEIELVKDLPFINKGMKVSGSIVKETLIIEGADVIAKFNTGEPAVTVADHGKGKAILIGSYLGLFYFNNNNKLNRDLIASLVEMSSSIKKPKVIGEPKIRVDVLNNKKESLLIIHNLTSENVASTFSIPQKLNKNLKEQFSDETLDIISAGNKSIVEINLEPKEVKVFF